jgi:hypothetical protein
MLYNTTVYAEPGYSSLSEFFSGFLCTLILSSPLLIGFRNELVRYKNQRKEDDEDEEEEEKDINDEEDLSTRYVEEFEALANNELSDNDLSNLQYKIVREPTAKGDIIMTYHKPTEAFWYYTDNLKEVSYNTLEAVARKFVIENNCKHIYLLSPEARAKAQQQAQALEGQAQSSEPVVEEATFTTTTPAVEAPQEKSVFAKFKKYNSGSKNATTNFSSNVKVIEQTNHFRYKGKLYDYEESSKETQKKDNIPTMSYADFKRLLENKQN